MCTELRHRPAEILALGLLTLSLSVKCLFAQAQVSNSGDIAKLGDGIVPPKLKKKVEPQYSPLARADRIQGSVTLQILVTKEGHPAQIEVLSPLGYGLDEKAIEAVRNWFFDPAEKDGQPIPMRATVILTFRLPMVPYDSGRERRRTQFNIALQKLRRRGTPAPEKEKSVSEIRELAQRNFPGALYLTGRWEMTGEYSAIVPKDEAAGWVKIEKAAKQNYGPALYSLARRSLASSSQNAADANGADDAKENEKNWDQMRKAAMLGSSEAQFFLADRYQRGDGVPRDDGRAKNYFRLCAVRGLSQCQYRLARMMYDAPHRLDYEYEQSLAWFELAADQGSRRAREILDHERPQLSPAQAKTIATLKRQFSTR